MSECPGQPELEVCFERRIVEAKRNPVGESGFTALELVVVVFLLSLIALLVFPSFWSLKEQTQAEEARRIASILRYLNDRAVSCKEECTLKVNLREGSLSWKSREGERKEKFSSLAGISLQSRGEVKEGEVILLFGPSGIQEAIAIHLQAGGDSTRIEFNPLSGRVKVRSETESSPPLGAGRR